jgi:RNA polymerase sigma-70 factor (ECF subfamily)
MQYELEEEKRLVEAAKADAAAFAELYQLYVDKIYTYCYYHTGDAELAQDLTAATFLKAIEELPRFQWRGIPYSAWLYKVASNLIKKSRAAKPLVELDEKIVSGQSDPDGELLAKERTYKLRRALAQLPPAQKQVVLLRYDAGLSIKEVAKVMGKSQGAVKALLFRAIRNLRNSLTELDDRIYVELQ